MGKTVIVMRHGKAKRPVEGQADIDRALTEAGVRSLAATLGASLGLWPAGGGRAEVWASPAVRARQTADLLIRALRGGGVEVPREARTVESLWTGDERELLGEVKASEADVIALVGHNPFSEELVRSLTGSDIRFATGALAAVELSGGEGARAGAASAGVAAMAPAGTVADSASPEPAGRLLWFAQGPVSQRWKTLVTMEKRLADAADTVQKRYDALFADPDDIETMHAFRVSMRKARSLIAFAKPWQDADQNSRIQDDLKSVVQLTSRQRELDVMWEQVNDDRAFSPELAEFCAQQAAAQRAVTLQALAGKQVRKRLKRARADMRDIRWKRAIAEDGLDASAVRARFDEMVQKLGDDLESLDLAEAERTHDIRKRAKRARYSAEHFKELLGDDAPGVAKAMESHQDDLGAICDARVNIDIINSLPSGDLPESIGWELALLRARYETFLYTALRDSRAQLAGEGGAQAAPAGEGGSSAQPAGEGVSPAAR